MMKKALAILLIAVMLFSLFGCSKFYEPVESTEREKTVVMTFNIDNTKYEMTYEMYRAFFLTHKDDISGGDDSVWTGDDKDVYIAKIEERIIDLALDIFSTFAVAKSVGIDIWGADYGKEINTMINDSIESMDSYDDYLAWLKALNLNYSMQSVLFRHKLALDAIETYYIGATSPEELESPFTKPGVLTYTDSALTEFYNSDECRRILRLHIQGSAHTDPMAKAERIKEQIDNATSEAEVIRIMGNNTLTGTTEIENGYVIAKYNLDDAIYSSLIDAAFSLEVGEAADPIVIHDGYDYIYYIVYNAEKSEEHFEANKTEVTYVYLWNQVGEILHDTEVALQESVIRHDFLDTLDYGAISMDEENAD